MESNGDGDCQKKEAEKDGGEQHVDVETKSNSDADSPEKKVENNSVDNLDIERKSNSDDDSQNKNAEDESLKNVNVERISNSNGECQKKKAEKDGVVKHDKC